MNNDSTRGGHSTGSQRGRWTRIASALAGLLHKPVAVPSCAPDTPAGDGSGVPSGTTSLSGRFASQLFANLLLELPEHRRAFTSAWLANDRQALSECTHRLAGAAVYCDLPALSAALAGLGNALREREELRLHEAYNRASRELDVLLQHSGLTGP